MVGIHSTIIIHQTGSGSRWRQTSRNSNDTCSYSSQDFTLDAKCNKICTYADTNISNRWSSPSHAPQYASVCLPSLPDHRPGFVQEHEFTTSAPQQVASLVTLCARGTRASPFLADEANQMGCNKVLPPNSNNPDRLVHKATEPRIGVAPHQVHPSG